MKKCKLQVMVVFVTATLAAVGCECSFSTARIASAKLAADSAGTQETTVFGQDKTFYCIVTLANAPEDTKLKAVWTALEAGEKQPSLTLDQAEMTAGNNNVFTFNLSNNQLWPTGKYKVDLYLNDKLDRTLEFEVR